MEHFLAGSLPASCPSELTAARDGADIKLTWKPGRGEQSVRVVRNGTELAAAAPVDPPAYIDTTAAPGLLAYELRFNSPGEGCSLTKRLNVCISDLTAAASLGRVELSWVNNFPYAGIVVQRGDDVLATIGGDQVSYTDTDAPIGAQTYSVVPENGDCEPVTVDVQVVGGERVERAHQSTPNMMQLSPLPMPSKPTRWPACRNPLSLASAAATGSPAVPVFPRYS